MPEAPRAGIVAALLALFLLLNGCDDWWGDSEEDTLCGDCDEDLAATDLGAYGAPPAEGFDTDADLVEFLAANFNLPPPVDLDGSDAVLVKVLFDASGATLDARAVPAGAFHSRPEVRGSAPPFWLVVTNKTGEPVYWRTVDDPRDVRSERPGATQTEPVSGARVRVDDGLATFRVPFVPRGKLLLHEAVSPGADAKPPLADYAFDLDVPLYFFGLGGTP